jgi:hypothetical protein
MRKRVSFSELTSFRLPTPEIGFAAAAQQGKPLRHLRLQSPPKAKCSAKTRSILRHRSPAGRIRRPIYLCRRPHHCCYGRHHHRHRGNRRLHRPHRCYAIHLRHRRRWEVLRWGAANDRPMGCLRRDGSLALHRKSPTAAERLRGSVPAGFGKRAATTLACSFAPALSAAAQADFRQ